MGKWEHSTQRTLRVFVVFPTFLSLLFPTYGFLECTRNCMNRNLNFCLGNSSHQLLFGLPCISIRISQIPLPLLETRLGGKGGERGGQWGRTKNGFGATPYFLVMLMIKKDEKLFLLLKFFLAFLIGFIICKAQKIFLYLTRSKKFSRQFLLS